MFGSGLASHLCKLMADPPLVLLLSCGHGNGLCIVWQRVMYHMAMVNVVDVMVFWLAKWRGPVVAQAASAEAAMFCR
jgi:hypothetical protein